LISLASSLASVDLPEPLSPTIAVIPPAGSASEMSSTACTTARLAANLAGRACPFAADRAATGKCLVSPRASSSGMSPVWGAASA
jgi:hypothetical protein